MTAKEESKAYNGKGPRERQINLRLSQDEYDRLYKSSTLCGLGRAAYLRMVLLERWRREEEELPNFSRLGKGDSAAVRR